MIGEICGCCGKTSGEVWRSGRGYICKDCYESWESPKLIAAKCHACKKRLTGSDLAEAVEIDHGNKWFAPYIFCNADCASTWVVKENMYGDGKVLIGWEPCPECNGRGYKGSDLVKRRCDTCRGEKVVKRNERKVVCKQCGRQSSLNDSNIEDSEWIDHRGDTFCDLLCVKAYILKQEFPKMRKLEL